MLQDPIQIRPDSLDAHCTRCNAFCISPVSPSVPHDVHFYIRQRPLLHAFPPFPKAAVFPFSKSIKLQEDSFKVLLRCNNCKIAAGKRARADSGQGWKRHKVHRIPGLRAAHSHGPCLTNVRTRAGLALIKPSTVGSKLAYYADSFNL